MVRRGEAWGFFVKRVEARGTWLNLRLLVTLLCWKENSEQQAYVVPGWGVMQSSISAPLYAHVLLEPCTNILHFSKCIYILPIVSFNAASYPLPISNSDLYTVYPMLLNVGLPTNSVVSHHLHKFKSFWSFPFLYLTRGKIFPAKILCM